ncbi:VOC family protein, partial [Leucobacter sp. M11]|uniref:VOC family protein n=1 Tax=Leucobacter sp. M11 TaxID=2993565 RepID=UPI002D805402
MTARLNPYLSFRGNAGEAMEFYRSVLGGTLEVMRYDAIPGMMGDAADPAEAAKVMHSQLETPDGLTLMAADIPAAMADSEDSSTGGTSVCVSGDDEARLRGIWDALSEGAEIRLPFAQAPWGDFFGDLKDRYGVAWMISL